MRRVDARENVRPSRPRPIRLEPRAPLLALTTLALALAQTLACGAEPSRPAEDHGGDVLADALSQDSREARELREVEAMLRARLATQDAADPARYDTLIDHALVVMRLVELGETAGADAEPDCSPALRSFGGPGRCAEGGFDLGTADEELLEAIEGWSEGARNDEALLHLGVLEWTRDDAEAAGAYFQRLVDLYPGSAYLDEACVNLGDVYFEEGALDPAREAYTRALDSDDLGLVAFATYKLAWIDIDLAQSEAALAKLWQVIEWAASASEISPELGQVAIRDTMLVYADLDNGWQRAETDLGAVMAPDQRNAYLESLAEVYRDRGMLNDSMALLTHLIETHPAEARVPQRCRALAATARELTMDPSSDVYRDTVDRIRRWLGPDSQFVAVWGDDAALRAEAEAVLGDL